MYKCFLKNVNISKKNDNFVQFFLHPDMENVLKRYFGYINFRPYQREIIENIMQGKSSLVLMPTGGGKSLCYQLPALMMEGTSIVISPLISLMHDQVRQLRSNGIPAVALNSGAEEFDMMTLQRECQDGHVKLIFLSPERLMLELPRLLRSIRISLIAVDEAHCISQWGHDFRPEYSQLGILRVKFPDVPIVALTATADKVTRFDILNQLNIPDAKVFIGSFDRPNLSLDVRRGLDSYEKRIAILHFLASHQGEPGIIYCLSKKNAESVASFLQAYHVDAAVYHAGLPLMERNRTQEDFLNDRVQVVCATIAFGMGINKGNVRFVIHYNLPKSIENYYQEIGRAGRDGAPADTLLFYNVQDIVQLTKFARTSGQSEINMERLNRMREYAEANVCRRRVLLNYFGQETACDCHNCDVCQHPPQLFDGTVYVQMALSAVVRANQMISMHTCIDILCGIPSQEVGKYQYFKLKTFGVGRDVPVKDWKDYLLQMLQRGFIEIMYDQHNHLHITDLGRQVLYGERRAMLAVIRHEVQPSKGKRKPFSQKEILPGLWKFPADEPEEDKELFETLRQLRLRIAQQKGEPPFVIMSDKVLHQLATYKPVSMQAFGNINGIGEYKCATYGPVFLPVIIQHKSKSGA